MSALREVVDAKMAEEERFAGAWGAKSDRPGVGWRAARELEQVREALAGILDKQKDPSIFRLPANSKEVDQVRIAFSLLSDGAPAVPSVSVPVERLRGLQWAGVFDSCPVCLNNRDQGSHKDSCWLAAALRDAEKEGR